jgi:cation diffusion facilitator family transporter
MSPSPDSPNHKALRCASLSLWVNLALAIVKGAAGILGNSHALMADAVESSLDVFGGLVLWGGLRIAAIPPDDDHPYGHGKAESLAAVVIAGGLLVAALGIAISSVRAMMIPHDTPAPYTLLVLVGVVVLKEGIFRFLSGASGAMQSTALKADAWHHRSDAITSVAAFAGISIALLGGPAWNNADEWAALLACMVIAWNGILLLRPAVNEIMDAAPDPAIEAQVRAIALAQAEVTSLDTCLVRKMGLAFFVDIHVGVEDTLSVKEAHLIGHNVKDAIRAELPIVHDVLVHIEPASRHRMPKTLDEKSGDG